MNLAILAAVSTVCMEAALFGAPAFATATTQGATAAIQGATATAQATDADAADNAAAAAADDDGAVTVLAPPEATPLRDAPVANTDDNLILDEEQFTGPLAFEDESDEAVVARIVDYLEGVDTLKGDFTQMAPSGAVSTGRFYLRRPGLLRFEYDPPTPMLIVANSGVVYVRDEALETTDSYPVSRTPLKLLLRDRVDLDAADVVAVDRGVDTVALTLAANDGETDGELSIILAAPDMALKRWIVRDLQNGITVVTLDNVVHGERLANRLFRAPDAGGEFLKN